MDDVEDGLDSSTVQRKGNALERKLDPEGLEYFDREEEAEVREQIGQIEKLMEDLRWTKGRLQRELGQNAVTVQKYLRGDMLKSDSAIFARAKALLKKFREATIGFVPLEFTELFEEFCKRTDTNRDRIMMTADHGSGRSFAASRRLSAKAASNTVLFKPLTGLKELTLLRSLCSAAGVWGNHVSLDETKASLIDHLRNSTLLLIVDDAEKLDDASLTIICEVAERTSTALVLVGTKVLAERVLHSPRLEWVRESLVEWHRLPDHLGDEEVGTILEKFFEQTVDRAVVRAAIDLSGKNLKRLCHILRIVRRSGVDGAVVSATMIQNAASQLLPRKTQVEAPAILEKFKQPEAAPMLEKAANAG